MGYALLMVFSIIKMHQTSRETYIENPVLVSRFRSNIVFIGYFEADGDTVKSLVKSDFFPYPILVPLFLNVDGI